MKRSYSRTHRFPLEYIKNAPKLHNSSYEELIAREGFLFTFNYNTRTNALLSSCKVPLYAKLLKPIAIPSPTRRIYKESNYLNYIINFVKHPFTKFVFGLFSMANLGGLLFAWQPQNLILLSITKSVFLTPAPLIGLSCVYGATLLFSYLSSIKIKKLIAKVDKIIDEMDEDEPIISFRALAQLENQNRIFFSYWYPGNHTLLFKYFFLEGLAYSNQNSFGTAESRFAWALAVVQNKNDEFICLRKIIKSLYNYSCRVGSKRYQEEVQKYLEQVPSNPELHAEITEELSRGLKECYTLIDEEKIKEAYKKFASLEFDAFTDEFYPHLSIMYYQMEAALTLSGKHFEGNLDLISKDEERLTIARHSLLKVQWYLDTYYPEEATEHRRYVIELERFWALLPVIPQLKDRSFMRAFDGREVKTIIIPSEKEPPNKHVKIEIEPPKLRM